MCRFSCLYCKDPTTGRLVHYNECYEYVDKLYELKIQCGKLGRSYATLDEFFEELEKQLFENEGRLFLNWLRNNRIVVKARIYDISVSLFENSKEMNDTIEALALKDDIVRMLGEFVI